MLRRLNDTVAIHSCDAMNYYPTLAWAQAREAIVDRTKREYPDARNGDDSWMVWEYSVRGRTRGQGKRRDDRTNAKTRREAGVQQQRTLRPEQHLLPQTLENGVVIRHGQVRRRAGSPYFKIEFTRRQREGRRWEDEGRGKPDNIMRGEIKFNEK